MGYNLRRYGDWALITGASSGIGLEFSRAVAAEGMNTVLVARRRDRLENLAGELEKNFGVKTLVIEQDLSLPEASHTVARKLENIEVGLLVLNAGFGLSGNFIEQDPERRAKLEALPLAEEAYRLATSHGLIALAEQIERILDIVRSRLA